MSLEAICWIRKLVLKFNKQKIFFWQLKKEISELKSYYNIEKNVANDTDFDWKVAIIDRIINGEEVLREQFCDTFLKIMSEDFELRGDKERKEIIDDLIKEIRKKFKTKTKDGEIDVEEMSNKNLYREESNNDILPPSKPYEPLLKKDAVIELEDKCKDCSAHQFDEEFGHMCISSLCIKEYDYDVETRIWTPKKEPTEVAGSARQTEENEGDFDCPICNKGVMIGYFLHKHCWEDLKADLEWLLKHAGHDDELETLEEYTEKMIELNKHFGKKEDADDR